MKFKFIVSAVLALIILSSFSSCKSVATKSSVSTVQNASSSSLKSQSSQPILNPVLSSPKSSYISLGFTGVWKRTDCEKASSATITIENQSSASFNMSFTGCLGGNQGETSGNVVLSTFNSGVFTPTIIGADSKSSPTTVSFILNGNTLTVKTSGDYLALGFGLNVTMDGKYMQSTPIYTNENIVNERLTHSMQQKAKLLLGDTAYSDFINVMENGSEHFGTGMTYSGIIDGAGLGVDLLIKGKYIYCKFYISGDNVFYTNDEKYKNSLPPNFETYNSNPVKYVFKP